MKYASFVLLAVVLTATPMAIRDMDPKDTRMLQGLRDKHEALYAQEQKAYVELREAERAVTYKFYNSGGHHCYLVSGYFDPGHTEYFEKDVGIPGCFFDSDYRHFAIVVSQK